MLAKSGRVQSESADLRFLASPFIFYIRYLLSCICWWAVGVCFACGWRAHQHERKPKQIRTIENVAAVSFCATSFGVNWRKNLKKREKKRKRKYKKYKAQFKSLVHFLKNRYFYLSKLPKLQMHLLVQQLKKKQWKWSLIRWNWNDFKVAKSVVRDSKVIAYYRHSQDDFI